MSRYYRDAVNPRTVGEGWDSLLGGGRILQQARSTRVPLPPCSYGVSASLKQRRLRGAGQDREAEACGALHAGWTGLPRGQEGPSSFFAAGAWCGETGTSTFCSRGRSGFSARLNSCGERLFSQTVKSRLALSPSVEHPFRF